MTLGIFLIILGALFLARNLGYISANAWEIIWPAFLVVLGISMIFGRAKSWDFWWGECWRWGKKKKEKEDKQ